MIKSVHLKNFQSHKDSFFDFSTGITSLTGSSNSGKTAILRAIAWVLTNRPSGETFVNDSVRDEKGKQTEPCSVTVTFDDGTVIERIRSAKENIYRLNGASLEAIGTGVPEEISRACNMSEVNLQTQMDAPFLLSESSGEVARFFNKIVKLDSIDQYLSNIESKKRKTKLEKDTTKDNIEKVTDELSMYAFIPRASELIDSIEKLEQEIDILNDIRNDILQGKTTILNMQSILQKCAIVTRAEELIDYIADINKMVIELIAKRNPLASSRADYIKYSRIIEQLPDIDTVEKYTIKGLKLLSLVNENKEELSNLSTLVAQYKTNKSILDNYEEEYQTLASQLPDICPLCGGELHE